MPDPIFHPARRLLVVDLLSYSSSHLSINSFWLKEIKRRLEVEFVAEAKHFSAVEELLGQSLHGRRLQRGRYWRMEREFRFLATMLHSHGRPVMILGATGLQVLVLSVLERLMPGSAKR